MPAPEISATDSGIVIRAVSMPTAFAYHARLKAMILTRSGLIAGREAAYRAHPNTPSVLRTTPGLVIDARHATGN